VIDARWIAVVPYGLVRPQFGASAAVSGVAGSDPLRKALVRSCWVGLPPRACTFDLWAHRAYYGQFFRRPPAAAGPARASTAGRPRAASGIGQSGQVSRTTNSATSVPPQAARLIP
jgi:hypothetical protein